MPRNRSEQDATITLPPFPVLEDAPYFVTEIIRLDARAGLGPGESIEGDQLYTSLSTDEQVLYENFQCGDPGLDDYCRQWMDWYTKLEATIAGKVKNDAKKQK